MSFDKHIGCITDFCGNHRSPGHWADILQRGDGSFYIRLGGWWEYYHEAAPSIIEANDPRYNGFVAACETGDDIDFVRKNW